MKELICITCPKGCHLKVDEKTFAVTGNACPRGAVYGENELRNPVRVLTSTVAVLGSGAQRLPVKTDRPIPKGKLFAAMDGDPAQWLAQNRGKVSDAALAEHYRTMADRLERYQGGDHILTDDQAPVELLGMRAIDGLIREEIGYYQNIYREQGITGLMDAF